jgi:hypothetical protein
VNFLKIGRWVIILAMLAVVTNGDALSVLGSAVHDVAGTMDRLLEGESLAPSGDQAPRLGVGVAAAGFGFAVLSYGFLMSLFTWSWRRVDARAFEDLTYRKTVGDSYIGCPIVLPCRSRWQVPFWDYILRLLPWLGVSIAVALSLPRVEDWVMPSQADPVYRALGEVVLLTMTFALGDTVLSYLGRRGFVRKLLDGERSA